MTLETSTLRRALTGFLAVLALAMLWFRRDPGPQILGHPLSFWLRQLDRAPSTRHPDTGAALHSLRDQVSPELRRRLSAQEGLGHCLVHQLQQVAPHLATPSPQVESRRLSAVQYVETLGAQAAPLATDVAQAFRLTRDPDTREAIGRVWRQLGSAALPSLSALALDPDPRVRTQALPWLGAMALESDLTARQRQDLALLISSQLHAAPTNVVLSATKALEMFAVEAHPALPMLIANLRHPLPAIRAASANVLGRISQPTISPVGALTQCLGDSETEVRTAAAWALGQAGPLAASAVPQLVEGFIAGPTPVALASIHALGRIGPDASGSASELASLLVRRSVAGVIRASAATALGRISRHPDRAVPALSQAVRDSDMDIRRCAIRALAGFGAEAEPAVPGLIEALSDSSESVRVLAAEALGSIGPGARSAVSFLQAARNNNQSVMSPPVLDALARIEAPMPAARDVGLGESSP